VATACTRNIEMIPLCKVELTLPWVLGSWEVHHGGGVDEQQEFSPARGSAAGSTTPFSSPSSVNLFSQLACYHVAVNAAFGLTK